eukprot:s660_g27.t3
MANMCAAMAHGSRIAAKSSHRRVRQSKELSVLNVRPHVLGSSAAFSTPRADRTLSQNVATVGLPVQESSMVWESELSVPTA